MSQLQILKPNRNTHVRGINISVVILEAICNDDFVKVTVLGNGTSSFASARPLLVVFQTIKMAVETLYHSLSEMPSVFFLSVPGLHRTCSYSVVFLVH